MIGASFRNLPPNARRLGLLGLSPQAFAVVNALVPDYRFIALSAGFFYAALIFSFVGGVWWGIASGRGDTPAWLYGAAVMPSLIAFGSGVPWMIGATWPWPSLAVLGTGLLLSPLIDRQLLTKKLISKDFFSFRLLLSSGLGALTCVMVWL
ncbi:MAG: DUF3429 domain-containing protein [Sphingomonadaceae bacterium]